MTVNAATELPGKDVADAIYRKVVVVKSDGGAEVVSIDDLLKQYYPPEVVKALPEVELKNEWFGTAIEVENFQLGPLAIGRLKGAIQLHGWSLFFIVLTVASSMIGAEAVNMLLQTLMNAQ